MSAGSTRAFSFLLDMNRLFERFVERLVESAIDHKRTRVETQVVYSSIIWNADADRGYSRVIPDLVVKGKEVSGRQLAIDAKYKLYDVKKIDQADIYQTFLYAYALGSEGQQPTALLLYPSSRASGHKARLQVHSSVSAWRAEIVAMGIPIPAALDELQSGGNGPVLTSLREAIAWALPLDQAS